MRLDAHQHFWRYDPAEHGWMNDAMGAIKRDFLPAELKPLLQLAGFDGCIAVQARQSLEETRWLLELAAENAFIAGVVGWVDLRSEDLVEQLEQFRVDPRLVGFRHVVQDEADDGFMLQPAFRRGIAQLAAFELTYDLLILPKHLPAASALVREFPQQPFVLDHLAKPLVAAGEIFPWEKDLRELAKSPNVCCKLSGMVTEASWHRWTPADFKPYLNVVFEAFGPDRLMIGSDWPVCTLAADYGETMRVVIDYVQQFSADVQEAVLGGNCARFYGIRISP
jgi:L-fuconolactonase